MDMSHLNDLCCSAALEIKEIGESFSGIVCEINNRVIFPPYVGFAHGSEWYNVLLRPKGYCRASTRYSVMPSEDSKKIMVWPFSEFPQVMGALDLKDKEFTQKMDEVHKQIQDYLCAVYESHEDTGTIHDRWIISPSEIELIRW